MQVLVHQQLTTTAGVSFVGHIGPWPTENPAAEPWAREVPGGSLDRIPWLLSLAAAHPGGRLVVSAELSRGSDGRDRIGDEVGDDGDMGVDDRGQDDMEEARGLWWGRAATTALDGAVEQLAGAGARVLLRPCAGGVLSDIPSVLRLAKRIEGTRVGILLEPAAMLMPSMLPLAEEHALRIVESLAPLACVDAVFLSGVEVEGGSLRRCSAVRGAPGAGAFKGAIERWRDDLPIVLVDDDVAGQRAALGLAER